MVGVGADPYIPRGRHRIGRGRAEWDKLCNTNEIPGLGANYPYRRDRAAPLGHKSGNGDTRTGRRSTRRLLGIAAALALFILAWAAATAGDALVVRAALEQPDAILSLASHEWERLPLTAVLAQRHPGAVVLLTVPPTVTRSNCHDCSNRVERLRRLGVDPSRVHIVRVTGPGTHGEAVAVLQFARVARIRRLLIATSPYHTRRSLALFRRVFSGSAIDVGIEPATASSPAQPGRWLMAGYDRAYVVYEWAAIGYYFWRYGVGPSDYATSSSDARKSS